MFANNVNLIQLNLEKRARQIANREVWLILTKNCLKILSEKFSV